MKNIFALIVMFVSISLHAAEQEEYSFPLTQEVSREVLLQVEPLTDQMEELGLHRVQLYNEISKKLAAANIKVERDSEGPILLIRLKSVENQNFVATFLQLAFYEDAVLSRNQNKVLAMTWSQATLIASSKEEFIKEVMDTVDAMVNGFILDYQKAFTKAAKDSKKE